MEQINSTVLRLFTSQVERVEKNNEFIIAELHDRFIRPLQQSRILKNVEVAKMLGVAPSTITSLVAQGKLNTTRDGKISEFNVWQYLTTNENNNSTVNTKKQQSA